MNKRGFTLVEVLLVIIIVGILAAITIPRIVYNAKTARIQACNANISAINAQLELYNMNNDSYPTLAVLFASADYFPDGTPACPFTSAYVLGGNNRVTAHSH